MPESIDITELLDIDPSRVDAVGSPANGTEWLMLKAIGNEIVETEATMDDVLAELDKATDAKCPLCKGDKTIKGGNVKCPKCKGTGLAPKVGMTEKELIEEAEKASAASGQPTPAADDCPTCKGNGKIIEKNGMANESDCPDCGGTGKDAKIATAAALRTVDAPTGSVQVGDARETVDKAARSTADENDLPDSAFAYIEKGGEKDADGKTTPRSLRHFPIDDAAHVRNALARAGQSPFGDKAMPAIKAAAAKFGIEVGKSVGPVEKDGIVSGPNPFLGGAVNSSTTDANATDGSDDADSAATPGSPDWEGIDADIATAAANALLEAAELIRQFADREAIEVAAGEGNDVFDTWDAQCALEAVTAAVGMMATLAFHEGVAAQKSTLDLIKSVKTAVDSVLSKIEVQENDAVSKSGKRLSTKSVTALAAARDHLTALMGDDDPAKSNDDDAEKSRKDIENMTTDELMKLLDERDEARAVKKAEAKKASKQDVDNTDSVAGGKAANAKAKAKKPKDDMTDLEDEADQGNNDSASSPVSGAAKAEQRERTPEEIEAREAKKAAKKQLRKAEKAEKKAAKSAIVAKAIEESTAKAQEAVQALQDRLATVEKMAAPSTIVKTRPQSADVKAAERDTTELEIARLERIAKETNDSDVRKGSTERAKELRSKLVSDV